MKLPIHGFVLAGGKSTRMGRDKALLELRGRPLVEIAVEKLSSFCVQVSIAGNRDDLARFAPVVREARLEQGPAAGVAAGLAECGQPWAMFVPVDVPLVPADFLRRWAEAVLRMGDGVGVSNLYVGVDQPAFCMLRKEIAERFAALLDAGERRLTVLLREAGGNTWLNCVLDPPEIYRDHDPPDAETLERWLINVNTPEEMAAAEVAGG